MIFMSRCFCLHQTAFSFFKIFPDWKLLWAGFLAFPAFDAAGCSSGFAICNQRLVIVFWLFLVIHYSFIVEHSENIWNGYFLRTLRSAIAAGCAFNDLQAFNAFLYFLYSFHLIFRQFLERYSSSCCIVLMPERIAITPSSPAANLRA